MKDFRYNDLTISLDELKSVAENYAEMYYYDTGNGDYPTDPMTMFEDEFGCCDDHERYMNLFAAYITLCETYKNDESIKVKYEKCEVCGNYKDDCVCYYNANIENDREILKKLFGDFFDNCPKGYIGEDITKEVFVDNCYHSRIYKVKEVFESVLMCMERNNPTEAAKIKEVIETAKNELKVIDL